jgi:hypothetical protein
MVDFWLGLDVSIKGIANSLHLYLILSRERLIIIVNTLMAITGPQQKTPFSFCIFAILSLLMAEGWEEDLLITLYK